MGSGFIVFTPNISKRVLIVLKNIGLLVMLWELLLITVMLLSIPAKLQCNTSILSALG
jgi:hypothetical protein